MASKNYQFNFVDEPSDKLKCLICFEVAEDPKQHEQCGKIFCTKCIDRNKSKTCPNCRGQTCHYFTDTRAAQEIRDLPLWCNNLGNGCLWQGTVGTLGNHLTTCKYEFIPCKYQNVGCDVKMMKKDITEHEEEEQKRLYLALQCISIAVLSDKDSLVLKMANYSSLRRKGEEYSSEPFFTHPNGYKMCLEIHANGYGSGEGTHLSVYTKLLKGPFDETLNWPFLGTVSIEILNQRNDSNHYNNDIEYIDNEQAHPDSSGLGKHQFISHSKLSSESGETQFLKNDTIYFRVSVIIAHCQPWLQCGKVRKSPVAKPIVFILDGYNSKKFRNEIFSTPVFFASPGSYRMYIKVYPNGNGCGKDTHISVFANIVEGPYDKVLSWPVLGNIKLELLNQVEDKDHFEKNLEITKEDTLLVDRSLGFQRFIGHCELKTDNKEFLKDDALYFRVTVQVGSCKPWLMCTSFS